MGVEGERPGGVGDPRSMQGSGDGRVGVRARRGPRAGVSGEGGGLQKGEGRRQGAGRSRAL